ncbi:MAG: sigma-70 family RNA polymerase sigma factor [Isosphaeraceae bacterium]
MASGLTIGMGGTLRHLRDLFGDGTAVGLGDGQLLARFADSGDQAAFEALVARHGPMVLATCRAVLKHEHDVEDAFQATFVVLARKARSVRAGDALGGWLHRVAYRAAVQLGADLRRRRRREAEASTMATPVTVHSHTGPDPEVRSIVHEEVDRLPEKHRLPVVLCDLEGLSYEQAAGRLHWTVPTLRCRLAKARQQLQGRLARRGITAGAVGIALAASASTARAAVPAALARSTVAAAVGGSTSAVAAALSTQIVRSLVMARLRIAAIAMAASASIASLGVVAVGAWRPEPPRAAAAAAQKPTANANVDTKKAPADLIDVRGRVVDPQGRPIAGASVRAAMIDRETDGIPSTTSAPDGTFRLGVPPWRRNSALRRTDAMFPWVVAAAKGYGPGWASAVRQPGGPEETTIRLVESGPPIEGRIVDLEGRPVAGARVEVGKIWFSRKDGLASWFDRIRAGGVNNPLQHLDSLPSDLATTTDSDGRFRLADLGPDRMAELIVSAPKIATAQLYVANRDGVPIRVADPIMAMTAHPSTTYYTRRLDYAAEPTRPIEGTIRDKESGRPIAGITLRGMIFDERSHVWAPGVEAWTDEKGHYRLTGLPPASTYRLFLKPGKGQPYTNATLRTPEARPALEPLAFDMTLKRGVILRGWVTDKSTGRPVSGYVSTFAFSDNPYVGEFPGYRGSYEAFARLDDDGRYEVVALPGRGIVACRSDLGAYRQGVGAPAIKGFDPKMLGSGGFNTLPNDCLSGNYHALAEIDPAPGAETVTKDIQVDPGRTIMLHVEDPEGRPLGGTKASGLTDLFYSIPYPQEASSIEVHGLSTEKPRRVTIRHMGRRLVASLDLKGDEAGPLTVRLRPWGVVTGRVVDDDGQPRRNLEVQNLGGIYPAPPPDHGVLPGLGDNPSPRTDRDGRFRIEGFVPGLKYGAAVVENNVYLGGIFKDVSVGSGETKDLGDLKVTPPRQGN